MNVCKGHFHRGILILLFIGLGVSNIGLSIVREQEPVRTVQGPDKGDRAMHGRGATMDVAVAEILLERGQAREALAVYKETVRSAQEEVFRQSTSAHDVSKPKEWTVAELVQQDFSPEERTEAIRQLMLHANARLEEGAYDEAVDLFERVFILDPLHAPASQGIDRARERFIKGKEVEQEELIVELENEERIRIQRELNRAWALIKEGAYLRARVHLERVLLIDPDHREAALLLAEIEAK